MPFPEPQRDATFNKRRQRFLAEIVFSNGSDELAYFANSGAIDGSFTSGSDALLWDSADIKRKLRYTLRAISLNGLWIGTDTHLSNRIVEEALKLNLIPGMEEYSKLAREQLIEKGCRIDFILTGSDRDCLIEVKSSTMVHDGVARYPDCLTPRGVKQLNALAQQARHGKRVILLFLIQRSDVNGFVVSSSVDSSYALAFDEAIASGVEVIAIGVSVSRAGFSSPRILPYAHSIVAAVNT